VLLSPEPFKTYFLDLKFPLQWLLSLVFLAKLVVEEYYFSVTWRCVVLSFTDVSKGTSPTISGSKNKTSKQPARASPAADVSLGLQFDSEDLNNTFLWNIGKFLPDYTASRLKRYYTLRGHAVVWLVEAQCYKPEVCRFDSRWGHWIFFNWPNPSSRTMTQPLTEMSTRNFPGG
jgi:hypothetical protein